ncbi:MAG: tRNA (adenosine(37)-N6)-threonylcarbamoyltransferase complex ATPase subunit type 1 TsaE [Bacteroidota bacterium]
MNYTPDSHTVPDLWLDNIGLPELESVATRIIDFAGDFKIWLLEGEMGAGKTTLVKAIAKQLGVHGAVQSPTYSLVNEYVGTDRVTIYHFDFYRIKDENEAMDIGVEEYFDSGNYCLIEWPSQIPSLISGNHLTITITLSNQHQRTIHLSRHGQ